MAQKKIDEETRQRILEARATGLSIRKIAEQFGVGSSSVGRIVKATPDRRSAEKEKKVHERNALLKEKLSAIERRLVELEEKIRLYEAGKRKGR